jgi:hypothetical protein
LLKTNALSSPADSYQGTPSQASEKIVAGRKKGTSFIRAAQ